MREPSVHIIKTKKIPGFIGYFITKRGKVYSNKTGRAKKLKTHIHKNNYPYVVLYSNGVRTIFKVHRLVALVYIPNPYNYPIVLHLDNDTLNCYYKNLSWGTHSMNTQAIAIRTLSNKPRVKFNFKLCLKVIKLVKGSGISQNKVSKILKIPQPRISGILRGKTLNSLKALKRYERTYNTHN